MITEADTLSTGSVTKLVDIPVPPRMKHLELDPRGYPIPWAVYRDKDGRAHFQINDELKRYKAVKGGLCPICGYPLFRGRWFVGGPISAFHDHGAFADPPMHHECAHYALMACPYLAAPRYVRRVDDKTLSSNDDTLLLVNRTMIERRPAVFICLMATRQHRTKGMTPNIIPGRPYSRIEYWQHGKQLSQSEGEALVEADRLTWGSLVAGKNDKPRIVLKPSKEKSL
jgi:hypothetical protein